MDEAQLNALVQRMVAEQLAAIEERRQVGEDFSTALDRILTALPLIDLPFAQPDELASG